jgi:hypothetical protein
MLLMLINLVVEGQHCVWQILVLFCNKSIFFAEHLTLIQELSEILHLQLCKQGQIMPNTISMLSQQCLCLFQVK